MRAVLEEKKNNCLLLSATLPALYIPTPWKWTLDTWTHLEGPEVTDHMTPSPESGPLTDHMADTKSKPMTDPRTNPMTDPMTNLIINHLINTMSRIIAVKFDISLLSYIYGSFDKINTSDS